MVSRETTVHIVAVMLAVVVSLLINRLAVGSREREVSIVLLLLGYGLVFGGAHFYLALRGEDGMVPVAARWRYLAMLLVFLVTATVSLAYGSRTIVSIEVNMFALLVAVLTLAVYFVVENLSAYRTSTNG
ncbi:MAG: hypothetical protein ACI9PP_001779 [Halobacteriales archaeon]|jgi:hypothetical protein